MGIEIIRLSIHDSRAVLDFVNRLLVELGEEGDEAGELDNPKILEQWHEYGERFQVFAAVTAGERVGVLTLIETFAIYANGSYGIINEMYVTPGWRSSGVGAFLVEAAINYGRSRGWKRIDVTAPESERWARTRHFYEKLGFVFTGPKLKILL